MFFDIFERLCAEKGVSSRRATTDIGLSNSIATKWKKTGATPDSSTLASVALYFGVSVDFLLTGEEQKTPAATNDDELNEYLDVLKNDPQQRVLFNLTKNATVDELRATVAFLKTLRGGNE